MPQNNDWRTPYHIIDKAIEVMGGIDTDPATSLYANRYIQAAHIFTEENNGLWSSARWQGNVWLNPPYSMPHIRQFTHKLLCELIAEHTQQAIMLVNSATDTAWFRSLVGHKQRGNGDLMFTRGRISFLLPDAEVQADANRVGQAIFYYGKHVDVFRTIFADIAYVV